ncbi:hypothetical protein RJT34_07126 [Clitoria ternatea]|uniref:Uncharacterized protein n=1 Tax=Clitoria ternatea TaxID=43366 RepID=A0AAN9PUP1_CLITE
MRIADSHAKTRERSKDKEIEEAEEVAFKRKSKETEVLEFATKQKLQEPERGIIIQTLQEEDEQKQKTKLQPQKIQSKEAHEIKAVNQDTIKPKKRKEEGEESTRIGKAYHGRENSKEKKYEAESIHREEYSYGKEEIKPTNTVVYQGAKPGKC